MSMAAGGKIAYCVSKGDSHTWELWPSEIYMMNADGPSPHCVIKIGWNPVWSPDGARIAYEFKLGMYEASQIYVANADGSSIRCLSRNQSAADWAAADWDPVWSPDGQQIAFASDRDRLRNIYVMNADGSDQHCLTYNLAAVHIHPTWSPDGQQIAFAFANYEDLHTDTDSQIHYRIHAMSVDGSHIRSLTSSQGKEDHLSPAWSPDGRQIAYMVADYVGSQEGGIYVMNADGSNLHCLSSGQDFMPAWSPDGQHIAFTSTRDGKAQIYVMEADGSNQRRLTDMRTWDSCPSWAP